MIAFRAWRRVASARRAGERRSQAVALAAGQTMVRACFLSLAEEAKREARARWQRHAGRITGMFLDRSMLYELSNATTQLLASLRFWFLPWHPIRVIQSTVLK